MSYLKTTQEAAAGPASAKMTSVDVAVELFHATPSCLSIDGNMCLHNLLHTVAVVDAWQLSLLYWLVKVGSNLRSAHTLQ